MKPKENRIPSLYIYETREKERDKKEETFKNLGCIDNLFPMIFFYFFLGDRTEN